MWPKKITTRFLRQAERLHPKKIKEPHRSLAFQYHSNRNGRYTDVIEQMRIIKGAYVFLPDPSKNK
jgi:curved DNA-binding protein CbpA